MKFCHKIPFFLKDGFPYEQTFTHNHPYVYEQTLPIEQTFTIAIVAGSDISPFLSI